MGVVIFLVVVVVVAVVVLNSLKKQKLKDQYQEALRGTDKVRALEAGRAYYASLRKDGRLTTYDETALNNDINTMRTE